MRRSGPSRLLGGSRQASVAFGADGFHRRVMPLLGSFRFGCFLGRSRALACSPAASSSVGLLRKLTVRGRTVPFPLQGLMDSSRAFGGGLAFGRSAVSAGIGPLGALPRLLGGLSF